MRQYPMTRADVVTQEGIDAGYIVQMVNQAFYDGFIVGICKDKEDFDNITPETRLYAAITAVQELAKLQGLPDPIEELVKKKEATA